MLGEFHKKKPGNFNELTIKKYILKMGNFGLRSVKTVQSLEFCITSSLSSTKLCISTKTEILKSAPETNLIQSNRPKKRRV